MEGVFHSIFEKDTPDQQIASFLKGLHDKGETREEILGAVRYLRKNGQGVKCKSDVIDCCGTGGDHKNTFNFSTAVSFVLAGAGCHVAKHGNRAVSSKSGSADILQELGINILVDPNIMVNAIHEIGIGFLFAPSFYPLMKRVGEVRKSLGHRSIFNILGPMLNPAGAKTQLIGVFSKDLTQVVASVLAELGSESAVVVHGNDGMDEFTLTDRSTVSELKEGKINTFEFDPRVSGYPFCTEKDLIGGTAKENAERLKFCLKGHSKPLDHVVHVNAAWGLIAAGKVDSFMDGLLMAQDSISSGRAYRKLEQLIDATQG